MIKLPEKRKELFYYIETLANPNYQRQAWVNHQFPPGIEYDCFDYAVNFLFDDTALADAPETTIGWILENKDEVQAIGQVIQAIDTVLNTLGTDLSDEEYISSDEWSQVVTTASAALSILVKEAA